MSRYSITNEETGVVVSYGFDHACGYFLQVEEPDKDMPTVDVDSIGMGTTNNGPMSNGAMLELYQQYGVPKMAQTYLALDMPF
jgi:hypothetical protein